MTKFSVLIAYYNAEAFIEDCLRSVVLNKSHIGEVLIFDDASRPESTALLIDCADRLLQCSGIVYRWHKSERNVGAGHARKWLIQNASYDLCAFIDADDAWLEGLLEAHCANFENPNCAISYASRNIMTSSGKYSYTRQAVPRSRLSILLFENHICTSSAAFRTFSVEHSRLPTIRKRQDYALWIKILQNNPRSFVAGISKPLVNYRVVSGSLSSSPFSNVAYNYKMFREECGFSCLCSAALVVINIVSKLYRLASRPKNSDLLP